MRTNACLAILVISLVSVHCADEQPSGTGGPTTEEDAGLGEDVFVEPVRVPPSVALFANPTRGDVPLTVDFTVVTDVDLELSSFSWNFGDGTTDSHVGTELSHVFEAFGYYTVTLQVSEAEEASIWASVNIVVDGPPNGAPTVEASIVTGQCAAPGFSEVELFVEATDPDDDALTYEWVFVRVPIQSLSRLNNAEVINPSFIPDLAGTYEVRVFVFDGVNRVASDVLIIEASDRPGTISAVRGIVSAGDALTDSDVSWVVEVINSCGILLPNAMVYWYPINVSPNNATTVTNEIGRSENSFAFGFLAGVGQVTATVAPGITATFTTQTRSGPARYLIMRRVEEAHASSTEGTEIEFVLTDMSLNIVDDVEMTFDLTLQSVYGEELGAEFDAAGSGTTALEGVTLVDGTASATLFSSTAQHVFVNIENPSVDVLTFGELRLFFDDFESVMAWDVDGTEDWYHGEPASGPPAAHSGTNLVAVSAEDVWDVSSRVYRGLELTYHGTVWMAWARFWHWYDMGTDAEGSGCTPATGYVYSDEMLAPPFINYPGPVSCHDLESMFGFGGSSGGWVQSDALIVPWDSELAFSYFARIEGEDLAGSGWFVDDVEVFGLVNSGIVDFRPGPPGAISATTIFDGAAGGSCSHPGRIRIEVSDEFGHPVAAGFTIFLSVTGSATFETVVVGSDFISEGATARVDTNFQGIVEVDVVNTIAEIVTVAASADGIDIGTVLGFSEAPETEVGLCGDPYDNDCDDWANCLDEDCVDAPDCDEAVHCLDGLDNDLDELVDCEDDDCWNHLDGICDGPLGDCVVGLDRDIPTMEMFACLCVSQDGCDDTFNPLVPDAMNVCHTEGWQLFDIPEGLGVCGVDCQLVNHPDGPHCGQYAPGTYCDLDGQCRRGTP